MDAGVTLDILNRVQRLSDTGRNAAVVAELGAVDGTQLERSPTLALLFGIAQGRLGRHDAGKDWVNKALASARAAGDRAIEARALNVSGAIAFEEGRVAEAATCFAEGLAEAERLGDRATVGRCANNLGIIANLRGDHGRAVGSYTMALAAFQHAALRSGIAETLHNLAITYRDQRVYSRALEAEERAGVAAGDAGELSLAGTIHCGRGEIHLKMGDVELARIEIQRALELHREVGDAVGEAEDLCALACTLDVTRQVEQAELVLRDVAARARQLGRSLLAAKADRDLAKILHRQHRDDEARELGRNARQRFQALGATFEVARLDGFLREAGVSAR